MSTGRNNKTNFSILFDDLNYKGKQGYIFYDVTFDEAIEAIRAYFDTQLVHIDGTDNAIWNSLIDLDCIDSILTEMEDWLRERCYNNAFEEYKEEVEEELELERQNLDDIDDEEDE